MPEEAGPLYVCDCGFSCYTADAEAFHRRKDCRAIKQMLSVVIARERAGIHEHVGVKVGPYVVVGHNWRGSHATEVW